MSRLAISTVEMHTAGEPTRSVVGGWPRREGATLLQKRREAKARWDHLRRGLMLEPRGHADMYGALLVEPDHPEADLAVLFMHNEGWSTMCGHATIALGRWAKETGRITSDALRLQCPCGLVRVTVGADGVRFESVPSFAYRLDAVVSTREWGPVTLDIGYGGAFYAVLPAETIGLDVRSTPARVLAEAGAALTEAAAAAIPLTHPDADDLGFLYGTILTDGDDAESRNVCVFAGRQVDRSPTGSGVSARIALQVARRRAALGETRTFTSFTGEAFTGRALAEARVGPHRAVTVEVGGRAYFTGEAAFVFEEADPLRWGFSLP
jgi:trans-L-3-hydroxyproline dehydratase